jgi:putative effector of murein hydrolase
MELLSNNIVLLALTFGVYYGARQLQKWTGWVVLNPILVTIAVLIVFLKLTGISYDTYQEGGHYIDFWLKPAIVALGVPLYQHLARASLVFGFRLLIRFRKSGSTVWQ